MKVLFFLLWLGILVVFPLSAQEKRGLNGIELKPLTTLSDQNVSLLGSEALALDPASWHHAETDNFIYHFQSGPAATAVSIEAEFYYRFIATDLNKDRSGWQRKAHIFIFESPASWARFQARGQLEPWTGGINVGNELFLLRDSSQRWKGHVLCHEMAHLTANRFFTGMVPLWLSEGYAENVARRGYAAFYRARGYNARPVSDLVPTQEYIPLAQLMNLQSYPRSTRQVEIFYIESDRLVRFLMSKNRERFLAFFTALAGGARNDAALTTHFGSDFFSMKELDEKFQAFAAKNYTPQSIDESH